MNLLKGRQSTNGNEAVPVQETPKPKEPAFQTRFDSIVAAAKSGDLGLIEHEVDAKKVGTVVIVRVCDGGLEIVPVARLFDGFVTRVRLGSSD